MSIRLNPFKAVPIEGERIPWCTAGRYLGERPVFTLDPLFHAGCYYAQEASSMFLEQAVKATGLSDRPILALDLCAAPGGKTTHLTSMLHPGSLVVANEVVPARHAALLENLWKWGAPNTVITGNRTSDFAVLTETFDLIVVDAPCSGEGMFRKDPFARKQWSGALVKQCSSTQRSVIDHAWSALRPGGTLIYSTCTWEREENEEQILRLIDTERAEPVEIPHDPSWNIERTDAGLRFYPHRLSGEGFFISAVRKPGTLETSMSDPSSAGQTTISCDEVICSLGSEWSSSMVHLKESLRVIAAGTPVSVRGATGAITPHPAACLSSVPEHYHQFDALELDHVDSLRYLRGEALVASGASGYRRVTHQGFGLGLVKGAGNRWNNLHPKSWRIRMR